MTSTQIETDIRLVPPGSRTAVQAGKHYAGLATRPAGGPRRGRGPLGPRRSGVRKRGRNGQSLCKRRAFTRPAISRSAVRSTDPPRLRVPAVTSFASLASSPRGNRVVLASLCVIGLTVCVTPEARDGSSLHQFAPPNDAHDANDGIAGERQHGQTDHDPPPEPLVA